jgi:hypothetical protein
MAAPAESETPEFNGTLLSLVLIFIPGILCYGIVAALGEKKDRDSITMFLQIFMYGICSCLLLAAAHWLRPGWFLDLSALAILNPAVIENKKGGQNPPPTDYRPPPPQSFKRPTGASASETPLPRPPSQHQS